MATKKQPYLTSQQLAVELEESQRQGQPTVEVCNMFRLMVSHILRSKSFSNYNQDLKDDLASHALEKCIKNIKNYKKEKADCCFNYYTRTIFCAFMDVLGKYYKHKNLIRELEEMRDAAMMQQPMHARNRSDYNYRKESSL